MSGRRFSMYVEPRLTGEMVAHLREKSTLAGTTTPDDHVEIFCFDERSIVRSRDKGLGK
jgi:hypothetical protein